MKSINIFLYLSLILVIGFSGCNNDAKHCKPQFDSMPDSLMFNVKTGDTAIFLVKSDSNKTWFDTLLIQSTLDTQEYPCQYNSDYYGGEYEYQLINYKNIHDSILFQINVTPYDWYAYNATWFNINYSSCQITYFLYLKELEINNKIYEDVYLGLNCDKLSSIYCNQQNGLLYYDKNIPQNSYALYKYSQIK